ncbi:MAG: HNH endonuclease [Gemmataceae bacterium]|nr:HNH endonuclease [Gemmataceae bacterium]MCI0737936.1 HNH endonuclease [Gemmataceae bacterium]
MSDIPRRLRQRVVARAQGRCEYCGLAQDGQEATFHIDHINPKAKGGKTRLNNLALACVSCSLRRGSRRFGFDRTSATSVRLFHPRKDLWKTHFRWDRTRMIGLTPKGRATIAALKLNRLAIRRIRKEEQLRGRHPPT